MAVEMGVAVGAPVGLLTAATRRVVSAAGVVCRAVLDGLGQAVVAAADRGDGEYPTSPGQTSSPKEMAMRTMPRMPVIISRYGNGEARVDTWVPRSSRGKPGASS